MGRRARLPAGLAGWFAFVWVFTCPARAIATSAVPERVSAWPSAQAVASILGTLEGWAVIGEPAVFGPDELKVSAVERHRRLLALGVQWVVEADVQPTGDEGPPVFVALQAFADPEHAFAVFSQERAEAQALEQVGGGAFWRGSELVFWYGALLARVRFPDVAAARATRPPALALAVVRRLPPPPPPPALVAVLPLTALTPRRTVLEMSPAEPGSGPTLRAGLRAEALTGELRIARMDGPEAARALYERWIVAEATDHVRTIGLETLGEQALLIELPRGRWSLITRQNEYVCAVIGAEAVEVAEGLLRVVTARIRIEPWTWARPPADSAIGPEQTDRTNRE